MKRRIVSITALTIIVCFSSYVSAEPVNWNAIEVNDIEYYMQTDKSVYESGEDVEMLFRVTNLGTETVTFMFGGSPEWNFWVEQNDDPVWQAVEGWYTQIVWLTLDSSEYKEYPYLWDMRDSEDILVGYGEYNVIGGFDAGTSLDNRMWEFTEVAVPVTIIPEPSSLAIFIAGLSILAKKNKHA